LHRLVQHHERNVGRLQDRLRQSYPTRVTGAKHGNRIDKGDWLTRR
jgi:hypothetical protein